MDMTPFYQLFKDFRKVTRNSGKHLFFVVMLLSQPVYSQMDSTQYLVTLPQRQFIPELGVEKQLLQTALARFERNESTHAYLQLKKHLNQTERSKLAKQGIQLHHYVGGQTWLVSITKLHPLYFSKPETLNQFPIYHNIRSIFAIKPVEKLSRKVLKFGFGHYAVNQDSSVNIIVQFFKGIPKKRCHAILNQHALDIQSIQEPGMLNDWTVRVTKDSFKALANYDEVQYVDEVEPPPGIQLDRSRQCANIDALHQRPYQLTGKGINIGVWDDGKIGKHPDLAGRVTLIDSSTVRDHATHVSGIIAGNGSVSDTDGGGTPNQWAGVATEANLFSYNFYGNVPEEFKSAIKNESIKISNNSWLHILSLNNPRYGDYILSSAKYDSIACSKYSNRIPIVFCAGNDQDSVAGGFSSLPTPGATAKNVITVGAVNSNDSTMTGFSSWGPTDDGRLKPEVVAAGCPIQSTVSNDSIDVLPRPARGGPDGIDDFFYPYAVMCGTSMATPVVTGLIALMMEKNKSINLNNNIKIPSTYKAILCNTAYDLVNNPVGGDPLIGPDYMYGFGVVDGVQAIKTVGDYRFRESRIDFSREKKEFKINVDNNNDLVVTLCWNDHPASPNDSLHLLKNDLDLVLINPSGKRCYMPWILDPDHPDNPAKKTNWELSTNTNRMDIWEGPKPQLLTYPYEDHVNIIEQVQVDNPEKGIWTARVMASDLPHPNQDFSIASCHRFQKVKKTKKRGISLHWTASLPMSQFSDIYTNDLGEIQIDPYPTIVDLRLFPVWKFDLRIYTSFSKFILRLDRKYLELKETTPYLISITPKLFYRLFSWRISPYITVGGGYYMQKDEENAFGYTYGIGLTYQLSDALSLQLGQNMHRIDNRDIEYRQLHTGFVFSF